MLMEALIFNGNGGIDQILRNILVRCPFPVCIRCMNILQLLDIAVGIHIVGERIQVKVIVTDIHTGLGQNIALQVVTQSTHKHHGANAADNCYRSGSTQCDLEQRKRHHPDLVQHGNRPVGRPGLARGFLLLNAFLIFSHLYYLH